MASIENPPAFPMDASQAGYEPCFGVRLRDYYAGQALAGLVSRPTGRASSVAEAAYLIADAMLAARQGEQS